jgi:hypothetical protein
MEQMIATTVERGISPDEVAGQVVAAVRSERFLVLTHPAYAPGLAEQAESLVAGSLPRMPDFEWTG